MDGLLIGVINWPGLNPAGISVRAMHMRGEPPARRVILLGASNLRRSFATVVAAARGTWNEPVEIMAAMGHGRSYGQDSNVLGRKISGIFPCALWQDLQRRPALPTAALVTDVGNDLLYGISPQRIVEWVAGCLDRLTDVGASSVITQLPVESVEQLTEARFRVFRSILFPRSAITLREAKQLTRVLNRALLELGESRKIPVISVSKSWYGFDSIHLKRRVWRTAWPTMLATWRSELGPVEISRPSLWTSAYLKSLPPWERTLLGIRRCAAQPCGRMSDGTTISLY
jgi:hypothetical protein